MENNYLKYSFMPKVVSINNGFKNTFVLGDPNSLIWNIMRQVTNDLGYNKIRESRKTNISTEELYAHLEKMDRCVRGANISSYRLGMGHMISLVNEYHKNYSELAEGINQIYELTTKNLSHGKTLMESYGHTLKEMDAEIDKGKIKEEKKEHIVPEKREKKKDLLSRIFNF